MDGGFPMPERVLNGWQTCRCPADMVFMEVRIFGILISQPDGERAILLSLPAER